ncbi:hypothetical protein T09_5686 [Trichinella sp. T9]|nr:hypothetical protein T09_5686 [Trichinella sp. T9]
MLHMATTCHVSKSTQTTMSTTSGIRTSERFHCRME